MKTVRQQVLEYLEAHRSATAEEIGRAFKMTSANARHHLSVLIAEGAAEIMGVISDGGLGRPSQRYTATRQSHRHNLDRLAHALLATREGSAHDDAWLERLAENIWAQDQFELGGETIAHQHLTRRLVRVMHSLNRMNYDARWEAHAQSPHIILNHCPYAAIIANHPELCQMDAMLLKKALGLPARQQVKLGSDANGLPYCRFVLVTSANVG